MTDNAKLVLGFLKAHYGEQFTKQDIQAQLGFEKLATVTGTVTNLIKKGRAAEVLSTVNVDGKDKEIKYVTLTADGLKYDPDVEEEAAKVAKAAEAEAKKAAKAAAKAASAQ